MELFLRYVVIITLFASLFSLAVLILKTFSFGRQSFYAQPQEKGGKGILYAFTKGMMPWEKESASRHFLTYGAGIFYHLGIFSAVIYILSLAADLKLGIWFVYLLRLLMAFGLISGLGLFFRRLFLNFLRAISCTDDYTANILVDLTLGLALLNTYVKGLRSILFLVSILLFLYIPLGKIRHCFFFFYSRFLFGVFFGRRGVLSQKRSD